MYITSIYNNNILININDLYSSVSNELTLNDYITKIINKKFKEFNKLRLFLDNL